MMSPWKYKWYGGTINFCNLIKPISRCVSDIHTTVRVTIHCLLAKSIPISLNPCRIDWL